MDYPIELNELALLPANVNDQTTFNPQGLQGTLDGNYFFVGSASNRTLPTSANTSTGAFGVFKRASYSNYYNYLGLYQPSDIARFDMFGMSISVTSNGGYLIAGAPGVNRGTSTDIGTVYVYKKNPTTDFWINLYQFRPNDVVAFDRFGTSTTITPDGTYLAASSPRRNVTSPSVVSQTGCVYIYKKNPNTDFWDLLHRINMNNPLASAAFGTTIEFSSDGTYLLSSLDGRSTSTRMTIVFKKDATTDFWSEVYRMNQFSNVDEAGSNFSMSSNAIYVLQNSVLTSRSTFLFVKDTISDIWNFKQYLSVDGSGKGGCSISGSGSNALVGWSNYFSGAGGTYFFKKRSTTDYWDLENIITSSRFQQNAGTLLSGGNFGTTVKLIGDGSLGLISAPNQSTLGPIVLRAGIVWPYSFADSKEISTNANYVVATPPASGRSIYFLPKASSTNNQNVFFKTSQNYPGPQFISFSTLNGDFLDSVSTISNASAAYNTSYQFIHDRLSNWYTLGSYGT